MIGHILITASGMALVAALWQIEIITGWDTDDTFDFPFYLGKLRKWVARDLWYAVVFASWALGVVGAWMI